MTPTERYQRGAHLVKALDPHLDLDRLFDHELTPETWLDTPAAQRAQNLLHQTASLRGVSLLASPAAPTTTAGTSALVLGRTGTPAAARLGVPARTQGPLVALNGLRGPVANPALFTVLAVLLSTVRAQ